MSTSRQPSQISSSPIDRSKWKLGDLNLLIRLRIIFRKDTAPILLTNAIFYMIYCCVQASLSNAFITIYHYRELTAGLVYLPFGFGCALASYGSGNLSHQRSAALASNHFAAGKIMNRDYRVVAKKQNFIIDKTQGDNMSNFPIEYARLRSIWYMLAIAIASIAGYGWSLYARAVRVLLPSRKQLTKYSFKHVAVVLVLQFLIGISTTGIFNICGTLLIDLHPNCPSAVSALLNLIRCSLAAAGLALLQIIIDHIGIGWCFTIFSAIGATTIPLLLAESRWGMGWRVNRSKQQGQERAITQMGLKQQDGNDDQKPRSGDSDMLGDQEK